MLSILIPIYNQDVRKLVTDLALQCKKCQINFQILCFDDASQPRYKKKNRQLESLFGVSYLEFENNIGRSRMRNKLGFHAMYDHMIFLDCDSKIVSKRYIKKYLEELDEAPVIYGGTIYSKRKPRSKKKQLHWLYGQKRERLPLSKRLKQPYLSFRSNNFLIHRDIFLKNTFDEEIRQYGHEDTLFAQDLKKVSVHIHHIDNPVQHGGLEPTDIFLQKVNESIVNLVELRRSGKLINTNLTQFHQRMDSSGLLPVVRWFWRVFKSPLMKMLYRENPSLRVLDLYKLLLYDEAQKKGTE